MIKKAVALTIAATCAACSPKGGEPTSPPTVNASRQDALLTQASQHELDLTARILSRYHGQTRATLASLLEEKPNEIGVIARMHDAQSQELVDTLFALRRQRKLQALVTTLSKEPDSLR